MSSFVHAPIRLSPLRTLRPIDVLSDAFLFGHRLAIGKLVAGFDELALFKGTIEALHDFTPQTKHFGKLYPYVVYVLDGIRQWAEREKQLHYEPTAEEKQAGIAELSKKLKEFSTIDAIAKRMGISHDDALQLPYATVYMMLLKDLEQSKFERRLQKVYERKSHRS